MSSVFVKSNEVQQDVTDELGNIYAAEENSETKQMLLNLSERFLESQTIMVNHINEVLNRLEELEERIRTLELSVNGIEQYIESL